MFNILHLSDIHYGKNTSLEESRLLGLAEWLNNEHIPINILVFTGDMIDSFVIRNECINILKKKYPSLNKLTPDASTDDVLIAVRKEGCKCCEDYDAEIITIAKSKMNAAGDLFKAFARKINVKSSNIVLCCGNHDCLRLANEKDTDECVCKVEDKKIYKKIFSVYDDLCKKINDELSHTTQLYSCDGCNFIILNTNWGSASKECKRVCIDCESIKKEIAKLDEREKSNCFLVAHKPIDDFCENTKFIYGKEKDQITIIQRVERIASAFLYGDKHSYIIKENDLREFMCGEPLSKTDIHYNLISYKPSEGIQSSSFLVYSDEEWRKGATNSCLEETYEISKKYLKSFAFLLLTGSESIPNQWDEAIKIADDADKTGRLQESSRMFATYTNVYPEKKLNRNQIYIELINIMRESERMQAVSIKGAPSAGKSTFVSMVYLYMLNGLYLGKMNAIPFYFDVRKVIDEFKNEKCQEVNELTTSCIKEFEKYLNKCLDLSNRYERPLWLFITGLESCCLLDAESDSIEKAIYVIVETKLNPNRDKYAMCFNMHDFGLDTSFDQIRQFNSVFFMETVRILPYKNNEKKLNDFLLSYMKLRGKNWEDNTIQHAINNLIKLHAVDADLSFMHYCLDTIISISDKFTTWELIVEKVKVLENIANERFKFRLEKMQKVAGILYSEKRRYVEIIKSFGLEDITIPEYMNLCNHPLILNYLIANYYVWELIHYSNSSTEIANDSILYSFITHDLAITIRVILYIKYGTKIKSNLENFITRHASELQGYLYSMIVYLCGHLEDGEGKIY